MENCKHINKENIEDGSIEIYTVYIIADDCCVDICEECYKNSNVVDELSPNGEASYTALYNEWN